MTAPAIFEVVEVCKTFRTGTGLEVPALRSISLRIEQGSYTVVTGASGSGKTTLLSLLGALDRPSRGQILFQGRDLKQFSDVELARTRRHIGFVFQDSTLIPQLPVWENVTYPLIPRGYSRQSRRKRSDELMAQLGISGKASVLPSELSGGERQRVALARALVGSPEVLLADEPVSNLDLDTGRSVLALFRDLHKSGTTIIMSAHLPEAAKSATSIIRLENGRRIADPDFE